MDDQRQERRDQKTGESARRREEFHVLVRHWRNGRFGILSRHASHRVAFEFDMLHLVQHHAAGTGKDASVVEETAHVAEEAQPRRLALRQTVAVIVREIDDAVDFALPHQRFRLGQGVAMEIHIDLRRGIQLMDKPLTRSTLRIINHRHRQILDTFVLVNRPENQRINQRTHEEYQHHSPIGENAVQFQREDIVNIFQSRCYIMPKTFHNLLFINI